MAKATYIGVDGIARKVKKIYIGVDGIARKVKKGYIGVNGVARLFYSGGLEVTYTGTHTIKDVTKDGVAYKLYTMTGSGTLTIEGDGAQYWMCGGGSTGMYDNIYGARGQGGGAGAYSATGSIPTGNYTITIAAAQGNTVIAGMKTANGVSRTQNGGTGGGAGGSPTTSNITVGTGDGVSKYPFGITSLYAHCAGGGGGAMYMNCNIGTSSEETKCGTGGKGGTNGGGGNEGTVYSNTAQNVGGGSGGTRGGGNGGSAGWRYAYAGANASFYGSGGGGAAYAYYDAADGSGTDVSVGAFSGSGYQGVCYLLVPAG